MNKFETYTSPEGITGYLEPQTEKMIEEEKLAQEDANIDMDRQIKERAEELNKKASEDTKELVSSLQGVYEFNSDRNESSENQDKVSQKSTKELIEDLKGGLN